VRLAINIDHVATIRNARGGEHPDPLDAARRVLKAGADGIVCHLREDRRHIRDEDVFRLRTELRTKLDLEMAASPDIVRVALKVKPDLVTLVPEKRKELTTEGGLNVVGLRLTMKRVIRNFHDRGIPVSLFIDPDVDQVEASKEVKADMIEIHTGEYAEARSAVHRRSRLSEIRRAARLARILGLGVNAGHGLDYDNVREVVSISEIEEVSIGYAIIVRALHVGLERAVREMVKLVKKPTG
jgi:pyridoxine 5-phosphate synthase